MLPCVGKFRITSIQGMRQLDGRQPKEHGGMDFVCADKRIRAARDGVVVVSGITTNKLNAAWAYGMRVWFRDANGLIVENNHLNDRYVKVGDRIKEGDIIGYEGWTGDCSPPGASHLHFAIRDKLGLGYKQLSAAEYLGIPNKVGSYDSETFFPTVKAKPAEKSNAAIERGDKVRVSVAETHGSKKYGRSYTNTLFRLYYDVYDVIGVSGEGRITIGIGSTPTAVVKAADLERLS